MEQRYDFHLLSLAAYWRNSVCCTDQAEDAVTFSSIAKSSNYMCCGQIEQTIAAKLIAWLGIMGGAAGAIIKIVMATPVDYCMGPVAGGQMDAV